MSQMSDLPASTVLLAEGANEGFDDSGSAVTWRFEVPYADRNQFLRVVAGLPKTFTYGNNTVDRLVPLQNPNYYNCYASSIRGFVPDGSIAAVDTTTQGQPGICFDYYRYDVTFTTPTFAYDGSEPMITVARSVGSEMVTIPGTAYVFPSDGSYIGHDVGYPVQVVRYSLTFHRLPSLNNSLYDSLAGSVNSQSFPLCNGVGQALYLGCSSQGQLTLGGQASYEATHEFEIRSIPHNQIMRPDGKGFEAPVQAGNSSAYLLPVADLNQLYSG